MTDFSVVRLSKISAVLTILATPDALNVWPTLRLTELIALPLYSDGSA